MTVGYEVLNDSGSILLDANYPNLALVARGTVNIAPNTYAGGTYGTVSVPATGMPLVFLRSAGFAAVADARPGSFTYFMATGVTTLDYWAFAPPQDVGARFGMQVYTDRGSLAFDAAQRYLRIAGVVQTGKALNFNDTGGVGEIASFGLPGNLPAVCFVDAGFQFQALTGNGVSGGLTFRTVARCAMRVAGNTLQLAHVQSIGSMTLPSDVHVNTRTASTPSAVIVADVANM